ncbi:hypothetical protein [Winogradskyella immobilis]|uniref:Uncharacterized protein n=1 Tax=Winogradskyella immobilis TaxID=2816852 RepID=A0ABS8EKD9_9FLAO|nr:hypothetical protein [Winogradskyella immobilis]MCC1483322.1 hypothetical protein [Winogradskyella immobilis]MCG0015416.1 hypothetical protein [Winogradskyella immobilis]
MKPTTNNDFTCLVFGHNYQKLNTSKLICKNCNTITCTDEYDNLDASISKDKTFEKTLKKLFLLKRKLAS